MLGRRLQSRILIAGTYLLLAACSLIFLVPIFWMVSTSLKSTDHVFDLPIEWIPTDPQFRNYPAALGTYDFKRYFVNSGIVAGAVTSIHVLLASWAWYGRASISKRSKLESGWGRGPTRFISPQTMLTN